MIFRLPTIRAAIEFRREQYGWTMTVMALVALLGQPRHGGATIDIAWELQREIDKFGDVQPIRGDTGQVGRRPKVIRFA